MSNIENVFDIFPLEVWTGIFLFIRDAKSVLNGFIACSNKKYKLHSFFNEKRKRLLELKTSVATRVEISEGYDKDEYKNFPVLPGVSITYYVLPKNVKHGPYKAFSKFGSMKRECNYVEGLLDGDLWMWWNSISKKQHSVYELGKKISEAHWEKDILTLLRNYKNGKLDGIILELCSNGCYRELNYKEGILDGQVKAYKFHNKIICISNYKNGHLDGEQLEFDELTRKLCSSAYYKNGLMHGMYEAWIGDVMIYSCNYENGKRHGVSKSWFENGQLRSEYTFVNDYKKGTWKNFDISGKLLQWGYSNDKIIVGVKATTRMWMEIKSLSLANKENETPIFPLPL